MPSVSDSFEQFEKLLAECGPLGVKKLEFRTDDPIWPLTTNADAVPFAGRRTGGDAGEVGYEAKWQVLVQRGGRVSGASLRGPSQTRIGGDNAYAIGQSPDALYLDPSTAPLRSHIEIKIALKRFKGTYSQNVQQLVADLMAKPVEQVAGHAVEDCTMRFRHAWSTLCYSQGNGIIAIADGGVTIAAASPTAVTVKAGTIFRFMPGERYVATSLSSGSPDGGTARAGTINSPGVFRCVGVDLVARTVLLQAEPGEGDITLSDDDAIILEGMYDFVTHTSFAFPGLEELLIAIGTYPGTSYDVANHPMLKALVGGDEDNLELPTPETVALYADQIAEGGLLPPSLLLAERSLFSLYNFLEKNSGAVYNVPQGGTFRASGGTAGPDVTHQEFTFSKAWSSLIRPGTIAGIPPETLLKFMPMGPGLIWARRLLNGSASIFREVSEGTQLTEMMDAPWEAYGGLGQNHPCRCFYRKGLHSLRTWNAEQAATA